MVDLKSTRYDYQCISNRSLNNFDDEFVIIITDMLDHDNILHTITLISEKRSFNFSDGIITYPSELIGADFYKYISYLENEYHAFQSEINDYVGEIKINGKQEETISPFEVWEDECDI